MYSTLKLSLAFSGSDIKTNGFSLETGRIIISLLDVSSLMKNPFELSL